MPALENFFADTRWRMPSGASRVAGWIVAAVALAELGVWFFEPAWLEAIYPNIYDMKFNTAVALLACGIGLIAAHNGQTRIAFTGGAIAVAIGGLTLGQHLTGLDFDIDQLLWTDTHHATSPYPGRISPGTSLALACMGVELVLLGRLSSSPALDAASELLGFFVFALGAGGIAGYLLGAEIAYNWGSYSRMSPHTAASLMLIGAGAFSFASTRQRAQAVGIPLWVPAALCFVVLLIDISTPRGFSTTIVYIPLVFCALWFTRPHAPYIFAAVATVLSALAYFAKADHGVPTSIVVANRSLAIVAIWAVAVLIHLRRNSEARLHRAESKLAALVTHAVDGIITISPAGQIESFNPASERIFGCAASEIVGHSFGDLLPACQRSEHVNDLARFLGAYGASAAGQGARELTGLRKDGAIFPIELSVSAFDLDNDRHLAVIVRDVTKRKEAEKATAYLASIIETSGDAVISQSLDGAILSWNAGAERLFGHKAAHAVGRPASIVVPTDCADDERVILAKVRDGETVANYETECLCRDDSRRHVSLTVSPIRDARGHVTAVSKVARDITDRKDAEAKLLRHTMALERSNRDLDDFAHIASHDLKEPLRGLSNNAKFLSDDLADRIDAESQRRIERIRHLASRMDRLIDDLLYFSRLGRQALAIRATDLNAVVTDVSEIVAASPVEGRLVVRVPKELPTIVCDKPRVTDVFLNLISNAAKYNDKPEKIVEVGCLDQMQTPGGVRRQVFYVKDNGIGIDRRFHEDVFRIFKRLNAEDDNRRGTGAGLTFVRKIVERHGGRIWLESEPGYGTTFFFTLSKPGALDAAA